MKRCNYEKNADTKKTGMKKQERTNKGKDKN